MRVSATSTREPTSFLPAQPTRWEDVHISSIAGRPRRRENLLVLLFNRILSFLNWILSFCVDEESPVVQRFQKISINGESIRYRIEGTENEVKLGSRCVRLDQLQLPDEEEIEDLSELLVHILDQEGIDVIETHNLYHAWILHLAGLYTKGQILFAPERRDPFNQLVLEVLKKRSNLSLANQLDAKLALGILADSLDMHGALDQKKAGEKLGNLEHLLGRVLDLAWIGSHVPKASRPHIVTLSQTPKKRSTSARIGTFSLPLDLVFSLICLSGKEIKKNIPFRLPLTKFTKG